MGQTYTSRVCGFCGESKQHGREKTNHLLHLILSVVTAGLWIPLWIMVGILSLLRSWRCTTCGNTN